MAPPRSLASWLVGLVAAFALAASALAADPAAAPPSAVPAPAAPEEDPYRWLEEVTGDRALDWVKGRNAVTTGELASTAEFEALRDRILSILDSDARIPYVYKQGKYYYNFWKDAEHPRGVWRRTTLASYRLDTPAWDVVLDVDALGRAEGESWVWHGASCLPPKYRRCLVSLSRGGADADVVREFDLRTRAFVKDGFVVPEAKTDVGWVDADTVFVGTDTGAGSLTTSGYPRQVRRWSRGTDLRSAPVVYEGKAEDVAVFAWKDHTPGFEREFVGRSPSFYTTELFLLRDGTPVKIEKPDDAEAQVYREWLYLTLRSDWTVGGRTYRAGSLLATRFDGFMAGERNFDVLFQPSDRVSLAGYTLTRHHVVLNLLDNVRSKVEVLSPGGAGWTRAPMAGLPALSTVSVSAVDPDRSDAMWITVSDYLTPTTLWLGKAGSDARERLKALPAFFNADGLRIAQHEATSADGTRVPYFEVARADLALDGTAPTLLYGYGGFEVSLLPTYSGGIGAGWLEKGGVYVVANIRGGGEFGPAWHQAALKANRIRAYEDFAAVARDLVARKVTSPDHLGIQGGSNGGLLMGNMTVLYPELFEAVVCQVPLLDMKRYNKLLAGASWMGEYGDPDRPEEWAFLQRYSPYHNVRADVDYPRVLFMTSTRDDRVHPGHARKMAARMLEQGHDVLYYENIEGGHGGAADNRQAAYMWALAYTFLWKELQ